MSFRKESTRTLGFQLGGLILTALTGMLTARFLGPADRGTSALILLYPNLFHVVGHLSIGLALLHHLGKREYRLEEFAGSLSMVALLVTAASAVLFSATVLLFREFLYSDLHLRYLSLAMIIVPFSFLLYYFASLLQGLMHIGWYNFANFLPKCLGLLLVFVLAWYGSFTVLDAILVATAAMVCAGVLSVIRARKIIPDRWVVSWKLTWRLMHDGGRVHLGAIATFIFAQGNMFIIGYYLPREELGYYYVAYTLANLLLLISVSVETVLYPATSSAEFSQAVPLVAKACRQVFFLTAVAAVVLAFASKYIVLLYGGRAFIPAVRPLLILIPGMVVFIIPKILSTLWLRKGWFLPLACIAGGTAVVNVILNIVLVPSFRISGAALANTLTYLLSAIFNLFLFSRFVEPGFRSLLLLQRSDWGSYRRLLAKLGTALGV